MKNREFLKNRIAANEELVHKLEVTANNFYDPMGKNIKGWNLLLGSRDKIKKLIEVDEAELEKLDNSQKDRA